MFDIEDSPDSKLERNKTDQAEMARVVRSSNFQAVKNQAGIRERDRDDKPPLRVRLGRLLLDHIGKVLSALVTGIVIAVLKTQFGLF